MKKLIVLLMLLLPSVCIAKPQQMEFTNFHSHAAVTALCTATTILVLRKLDVPSPWNEIGGAVVCTAAVTVYKEGRDPVWDWGDAIANGAGGAGTGTVFFIFRKEF